MMIQVLLLFSLSGVTVTQRPVPPGELIALNLTKQHFNHTIDHFDRSFPVQKFNLSCMDEYSSSFEAFKCPLLGHCDSIYTPHIQYVINKLLERCRIPFACPLFFDDADDPIVPDSLRAECVVEEHIVSDSGTYQICAHENDANVTYVAVVPQIALFSKYTCTFYYYAESVDDPEVDFKISAGTLTKITADVSTQPLPTVTSTLERVGFTFDPFQFFGLPVVVASLFSPALDYIVRQIGFAKGYVKYRPTLEAAILQKLLEVCKPQNTAHF